MSPSTANAPLVPHPRAQAPSRYPSFDGAYDTDEVPPELYDEDEDRDDLTTYIHIAESYRD